MNNCALERLNCQEAAYQEAAAKSAVYQEAAALVPLGTARHLRRRQGQAAGGEGGIRTPGTVTRTPHFECGAFNHSATSPNR